MLDLIATRAADARATEDEAVAAWVFAARAAAADADRAEDYAEDYAEAAEAAARAAEAAAVN